MNIVNYLKKDFDEEPDTNMPDLESEQSAAERRKQKGQGLNILTPNQMLSRLPISLAQKMSIIIWSTLFKNESNLYEHWKQ